MNFLFSIIVPVYNSEKFLEECILSVQNQSYKNYEHLIIDGNSTDNTINVIKKHEQNPSYYCKITELLATLSNMWYFFLIVT